MRAWEADVVLRDGGAAHLRPITPEDAERLQAFHLAQSPESVYLRFFAPMPRLSERDLRRFTTVDHVDRVALVVLVGDQIIGVGRYDRIDAETAEVAFNISDAHQGRGVGSVLLEHLAAAARENGISRFVAEVLPENRRMVQVFVDAGYEVSRHYDDGVISMAFAIDPTDRSLEVMAAREHRAEAQSLRALLHPASVVVVGASRRPGSVGGRLLADLLDSGFTGDLHVVHPQARAEELRGVQPVRSLAQVPAPVDLAVVAVPAPAVVDVVRQCAPLGVRGVVVVSNGFAETGPEGLQRQRELVRVARANGMRVVGPNSFGLVNTDPEVRLNASLYPTVPGAGGLALFSQSGALGVAVLDAARRRHLGVSSFLSAGNRADVSGNDCMQYWQEDDATVAVGMYLESVGNPRKFSRVARQLSRRKPVVAVKSGVSSFTVPPGHAVRETRAPREALEAMLRQAGVVRVDNMHQLFDVAQLLVHQPLPHGERIGIVGNSDALAALAAEAALSWGLQVAEPVTVHPEAGAAEVRAALERVFGDPAVDAVVACFIPALAAVDVEVARALRDVAASSDAPCVACLVGMRGVLGELDAAQPLGSVQPLGADAPAGALADALADASAGGRVPRAVPAYPMPEDAVRALAATVRYAAWRRRDPGHRVEPAGLDRRGARALVEELLAGRTQEDAPLELAAEDAAALLACYGVRVWPAERVSSVPEALRAAERVGWPVVLKATQRSLRRPGMGGVRADIADEAELRADVATMLAEAPPDGRGRRELLLQHMAPAGVACLVRTLEDPLFGPIVSFGLAGDTSELLGDLTHRIPPLTDVDVADLVRGLRAAPRLLGGQGSPPVDVAALEDLLARASVLADDLPEVAWSELSPVQVSRAGLAVLGATVVLAVPAGRSDAGRRALPS
ncbi:Acyl-CoA synthetase (NDP forming) [Quadrisphaera sp. DSM 44207]|nr:Acyl-CoA synthetase (NDP forming) [Quadrisphaera sp. DSM 44207]